MVDTTTHNYKADGNKIASKKEAKEKEKKVACTS